MECGWLATALHIFQHDERHVIILRTRAAPVIAELCQSIDEFLRGSLRVLREILFGCLFL